MNLRAASILAISCISLSSCASCWVGGIPLRSIERAGQKQAARDFRQAQSVQVFRGLAHPIKEKNLYRQQKQSVKYMSRHGFEFFQDPISLPAATVREIQALYENPESHQALSKKDLCSFHPDYLFTWKKDGQARELHICYGCHEWRYYGPVGEFREGIVSTDINEPAYFEHLTRILPKQR